MSRFSILLVCVVMNMLHPDRPATQTLQQFQGPQIWQVLHAGPCTVLWPLHVQPLLEATSKHVCATWLPARGDNAIIPVPEKPYTLHVFGRFKGVAPSQLVSNQSPLKGTSKPRCLFGRYPLQLETFDHAGSRPQTTAVELGWPKRLEWATVVRAAIRTSSMVP